MVANRKIIEEKDEKIAELERLLIEFKEAPQQSAATIAVDHNSRLLSPPKGTFKFFFKVGRIKIILSILVVFLAITAGVIWLSVVSTFKQESAMYVEHIQELGTLATAEAYMKAVLHEEDNKIFGKDLPIDLPGTKRELLLVVPGTVIAGVDLKGITSEDMVINKDTKVIDITLPHAKIIQDPSLQLDKIQAVDNAGLLRANVKMDQGFKKAAEAQELIRQDAISVGLLDTAEKNAEKVLKEFFKNIDYTVNVTFN